MSFQTSFACSLALLLTSVAAGGNWGNWRGPAGNGSSPDAKPPVEWSATKNVKWKVPVPGLGSGSPVIWEDRVFVVSAVAADGGRGFDGEKLSKLAFRIFCFDRGTGKLRWEKTATTATPHQGTHSTNGFASASPVTNGKHVYAHFGSRGLYCYTMDGELVWKRDDFGKMDTRNDFGEGSSPTLEGDKIIVPWDHEGPSALYALNRLTGKTIWKTERDEPTNWCTPFVVEHDGAKQVVMNGQTFIRGYDLETGKELWRIAGKAQRPVTCAVAIDELVIVASGFRGSYGGAFRLSGRGDLKGTKNVAWSWDKNTPDLASPLLSDELLYMHKAKSASLSCINPRTGEAYYTASKIPGLSTLYASSVAAGGHVYITGRSGTTVVIKDGKKLEIVSTNSVDERVDATPAPVDNQLFIRSERHLFCIEAGK
ncbi:PQQ-like beta-propeller repeat protein [Akkermansiaceae bacterium]|nr:PQQ-like beta-propeller repeat protein [Akkermansiaceae bacterium]MDB4369339.1 PQQ-like beta-propeller repeat protein [Akkermansiaceae bacterium]